MRSPRALAGVPALLALALLSACAGGRPRPKPANVPVLTPTVTVRGATLASAGFEGVTVDVALEVENPNPFALPVARLTHAVEVEGAPAFSGSARSDAAVAAQGTSPVTVPVFLPYGRIPDIGRRIGEGRPIAYRATGAVGLQTPAGVLDLPVCWAGTLPLPRLPAFSFEGVDVVGLGALALTFDVLLRVQNPNAFPIPPGALGHHLAVAGAPVAAGDQRTPGVPAGGSATFAIPARVNLVGAGTGVVKGVWTALQGAEVPVALEGHAAIAGIPMEVRMEARIARLKK